MLCCCSTYKERERVVVRQDSKVLKYKIQYFSDMKDLMIIHIEIGLCTP